MIKIRVIRKGLARIGDLDPGDVLRREDDDALLMIVSLHAAGVATEAYVNGGWIAAVDLATGHVTGIECDEMVHHEGRLVVDR